MATYPFVRLEEARRRLLAEGIDVIDFGKGDPNEPTDPMHPAGARRRGARALAVPARAGAAGAPAGGGRLVPRRFGVEVDPDTEIVPTYGSKEAIFSLAQVLDDRRPATVVFGEPAYPVYERGALFAGARVHTLPLVREQRLPARPRRDRRDEHRARLGQLPEQPDGRDRAALVLRAARRARRARTAS